MMNGVTPQLWLLWGLSDPWIAETVQHAPSRLKIDRPFKLIILGQIARKLCKYKFYGERKLSWNSP